MNIITYKPAFTIICRTPELFSKITGNDVLRHGAYHHVLASLHSKLRSTLRNDRAGFQQNFAPKAAPQQVVNIDPPNDTSLGL